MGVVYFSIIPTFEPSRYCKCWIVCFMNRNLLGKKQRKVRLWLRCRYDQAQAFGL